MWCPKCRVEYQDGVTECVECGTPLVEGTAEDFDIVDICSLKDKKMADKFAEYLEYSKLSGIQKIYDEEEEIFTIAVPTKLQKKAEKLFDGFLMVVEEDEEEQEEISEQEELDTQEENPEEAVEEDSVEADEEETEELAEYDWDAEEEDEKKELTEEEIFAEDHIEKYLSEKGVGENPNSVISKPSQEYVKKADQYKDYLFSGITFVVFGVLGLVYLTLCKLEVFSITYNIIVFSGLVAMFAVFVIIGISSFVRSFKVKSGIVEEEEKIREINQWLKEHITEERRESWKKPEVSDEENDLYLMAHIQSVLSREFPEENADFLEMLSEKFYNEEILGE